MSERRTKHRRTKADHGLAAGHPMALWPQTLLAEDDGRFDFTDLDEPGASAWWQWLKR